MDVIWTIILILFILWLAGFGFHIAGDLVNILLILIVVGVVYQLMIALFNRTPRV